MAPFKRPNKKPLRYKTIPIEKAGKIPAVNVLENILVSAGAPERIRQAGVLMLNREHQELEHLQKFQSRHRKILSGYVEKGLISVKEFNSKMNAVDEQIRQKLSRMQSIREKMDFLLEGRMRQTAELALNDPMYTFIRGHKAYSTIVQRRLATKGVQTVAFADVDKLKDINEELGYRQGGTNILRIYAEAAKETAVKYNGIASHYGGDEFTFHFYRTANEVAAIMREFQNLALRKIMSDQTGTYAALAGAIRDKIIPGTATVGVMQIDFPLHEKKFAEEQESGKIVGNIQKTIAERKQIYSSVMDWVSRPLSKKEPRIRGSVLIIKDEAKEAVRKR